MEVKNVGMSTNSSIGAGNRTSQSNITGNVPVTKAMGASVLANMEKGSTFSGDIIDVRNNAIKILLDGNETLNAKAMDATSLNIGDHISFVIKDNTQNSVLIKALNVDNRYSSPLFLALESANIPVTERGMKMVNEMMKNEMPIDKASVNEMYKQISNFENADAASIVNMVRHELPLTDENITQFENYINYEHRISSQLDQLATDITDIFKSISANESNYKSIDVSTENVLAQQELPTEKVSQEPQTPQTTSMMVINDESYKVMDNILSNIPNTFIFKEQGIQFSINSVTGNESNNIVNSTVNNSIIDEISDENINYLKGNNAFDSNNIINNDRIIIDIKSIPKEKLQDFLNSNDFHRFIKSSILKNFSIDINSLQNGNELKNQVKEIYEGLNSKLDLLMEIFKNNPGDNEKLQSNINNIKNNLTFMADINQLASYVQLPLKFSDNTEHGELYVFNKSHGKMIEKDVLTAFMHLDMENLGPTDCFIKLENNKLSTNFTLANEDSMNLVLEHIDELQEKLKNAGFDVSINVSEEKEISNPFEKVLEADRPKLSIKRYNFDVRA